ncbi:MAG: hypothetical protein H0U95_04555 [Bacteroidetes bacterium]|nr:hypothetical protein [Bacteroidota bacterium]
MKANNYKIVENRADLTAEQVVAGMGFSVIQKKSSISAKNTLNTTIITGLAVVAIIAGFVIYNSIASKPKQKNIQPIISDTLRSIDTNRVVNEIKISYEIVNNQITEAKVRNVIDETIINDKVIKDEPEETLKPTRSLSFQRLANADAQYAIEIKDSVYGPVNVSKGYGEYNDVFFDKANPKVKEVNSAWFKFKVTKDTLLTFHIVPTLGTDDYDFILYKCVDKDCNPAIRNKPLRVCFAWNSSMNPNTGLSNSAKDTTYEGIFANGEKQGKTYASVLKVKSGETYYLMVTNNLRIQKNQDPEGFMLYFYNYLPKKKANKYK